MFERNKDLNARVAALEQALDSQEPRLKQVERRWVHDAPVPGRERSEPSERHPVSEPSIIWQFLSILEDWGLIKLYHQRISFERGMFQIGFPFVSDNIVYLIVVF